jgi:hypothetical protein
MNETPIQASTPTETDEHVYRQSLFNLATALIQRGEGQIPKHEPRMEKSEEPKVDPADYFRKRDYSMGA